MTKKIIITSSLFLFLACTEQKKLLSTQGKLGFEISMPRQPADGNMELAETPFVISHLALRIRNEANAFDWSRRITESSELDLEVPVGKATIDALAIAIPLPAGETQQSYCSKKGLNRDIKEGLNAFYVSVANSQTDVTATTDTIAIAFPDFKREVGKPAALKLLSTATTAASSTYNIADSVTGQNLFDLCTNTPLAVEWNASQQAVLFLPFNGLGFQLQSGNAAATSANPLVAPIKPLTIPFSLSSEVKNFFNVDSSNNSVVSMLETEDFDGDGINNLAELNAGTNPRLVGGFTLPTATVSGQTVAFSFTESSYKYVCKIIGVDTEFKPCPTAAAPSAQLAQGQSYSALVRGLDVFGYKAEAADKTVTFSIATPPPPAAADIILGSVPTGTSGLTTLAVTVSGVVSYRYKLVDGTNTCSTDASYSAPVAIATNITDSLSAVTNGQTVYLCVRGIDAFGGETTAANAKIVSWIKDTTVPTAGLSNPPATYMTMGPTGFVVNGSGIAEYKYVLTTQATSCGTVSYPTSWTTVATYIVEPLSEGTAARLCLLGKTGSGLEQAVGSPTVIDWTWDSVAPVAADITLSETPSSTSNALFLNVTVSPTAGAAFTHYKSVYKADGSACDQPEFDAESWIPIATHITNPISGSEGNQRLCVIAKDAAGNLGDATRQAVYTWVKDVTKPTIANLTIGGAPADPSNGTNLNVTISGTDVNFYKFALTTTGGTSCSAIGYGSWTAIATAITAPIGADATNKILCVIAKDLAGNDMDPTISEYKSVTWKQDTVKPAAADIILNNLPLNPSSSTSPYNIDVSGTDITHYKYVVGSNSINCASATYPASWIAVATHITDPVGSDGDKRVCVIAKDNAGNEMVAGTDAAKQYDWLLDSVLPAAADVTLSGTPSNPSTSSADLDVTVTGSANGGSPITHYKYAYITTPNSCAGATYSATQIAIATHITDAVGSDSPVGESRRLCVILKDAAGNWQTQATAQNYDWVQDTAAPSLSLTTAMSGAIKVGKFQVTVNSPDTDITHFKWDIVSNSQSCTAAPFGGGWIDYSVTSNKTFYLIKPPGEWKLCGQTKDIRTNISNSISLGDWYQNHRIFVTAANNSGRLQFPSGSPTFFGIQAADAICNDLASTNTDTSGSYWKAILSDASEHAVDRISFRQSIYNNAPSPSQIAVDGNNFWNGSWQSGISAAYLVTHAVANTGNIWTGSAADGHPANTATPANTCHNWTTDESGINAQTGSASVSGTNATWLANSAYGCSAPSQRLYCIEQSIPVFGGKVIPGTTSGKIKVTIDVPPDKFLIDTIKIFRSPAAYGAKALPSSGYSGSWSSNCTGAGIYTFTSTDIQSASPGPNLIWEDTPTPSKRFSYRACVFDASNNLLTTFGLGSSVPNGFQGYELFVTQNKFAGNFLASGANPCAAAANEARLDSITNWSPLVATSSQSINDRFPAGSARDNGTGTYPIYKMDTTPLTGATNWAALVASTAGTNLSSYLDISELGAVFATGMDAWTGAPSSLSFSNFDGTNTCTNWTSLTGSGLIGNFSSAGASWLASGTTASCSIKKQVYCIKYYP